MYLLGLGLVFLTLKLLALGPVASWGWLAVLWPFGLAVVWWTFADLSGYTRAKAMAAMDKRRQERIQKNRAKLGTDKRRHKPK